MNFDSTIYVAGHNGLVGSAIVKALQRKGYRNIIGKSSNELDLRNPLSVQSFFNWAKPEYVFLAAAKVGGIIANNTYRADFIYDNLMIQSNVIHQSYLSGVKKLLFLGSTCIYPRDCPQPMKEEYLLTGPLEYTNEPYAIAKIAGMKMCESYNIQYGTNFLSVMPTNLYGSNDNFDLEKSHVLPALIRKIHLGKCLEENNWQAIRADLNKHPIEGVTGENDKNEILQILDKYGVKLAIPTVHGQQPTAYVEIWGSGTPMREFLWSEDMADACVFIMENIVFNDLVNQQPTTKDQRLKTKDQKPKTKDQRPKTKDQQPETRNTHLNIGTGKEISIKHLAELVKQTIGFQGELFFNTSKPDGTPRKLTDPSKLNQLGWKHSIELEEGIKRIYDWYVR